jgi:hypothetical protein
MSLKALQRELLEKRLENSREPRRVGPRHGLAVETVARVLELGRRLRRLIGTYAGQALAPACQLRHVADPPHTLLRQEPVADVQRTRATDDTHLLKLESDDEKIVGDRFERDLVSDRLAESGQLVVQSASSKEVVQSPKDSPTLATVELDRPVTRRCLEKTSRADGIEVCAFASRQAQFFRELRDRLRRQGNFDTCSQDAYGQLETSLDRPQEK